MLSVLSFKQFAFLDFKREINLTNINLNKTAINVAT